MALVLPLQKASGQAAGCAGIVPIVAGQEVTQTNPSHASITLTVPGVPPQMRDLTGTATVKFTPPVGALIQPGLQIPTELVSMSLTSADGVMVTTVDSSLDPKAASRGMAILRTPLPDGNWAVDSFFDVFFEVDIPQLKVKLSNYRPALQVVDPLRVSNPKGLLIPLIHTLPFELVQEDPTGRGTRIVDAQGQVFATVTGVKHGIDPPPPEPCFKRGDANCDGCVDRKDVQAIRDIIANQAKTCCPDAADANDDGKISIDDATYLANYLSGFGPPPPAPGPDKCGPDPTRDTLPPCDYPARLCNVQCPPKSCFPPAGTDVMDSSLEHDIDIPGIGLCVANLKGPVTVQRSDPYVDPATGLQCIDTEIVGLDLLGVDPVCGRIRVSLNTACKTKRSAGKICELVPGTCFPAESCFNVFIKVELLDLNMCLYACEPAKMCCTISAIPPFGCLYNLNIGQGGAVPLYRGPCTGVCPCDLQPLPPPAAYIIKAVHQPLPPDQCKCFPKAGEDVMNTTLFHDISLPGLPLHCTSFTGPMVVRRSDPFLNDQGLCCIKTEIIKMEMKGTCDNGTTAIVRLCPQQRSFGLICEKEKGTCFPANSCFNVFIEVEVQLATGPIIFKNCKPAVMCCMINALPPLGCQYALQNPPVELYRVGSDGVLPCLKDPLPTPDGFIQNANHIPRDELPPCCPEYGPGTDVMDSSLEHDIEIPGIGVCKAQLAGPVAVGRGKPYRDPLTGLCCVETEIISLDLRGVDPACGKVHLILDPARPSKGRICEKAANTCFPANSCFDVFVRIEVELPPPLNQKRTFTHCEPAHMCCMIDKIPPFGCLYNLDIGAGTKVPLYEVPNAPALAGGGGSACVVPDDGTGTASLPPEGCEYLSPDDVHMIIDGLPAGTTIRLAPIHRRFICEQAGAHCGQPGGTLGGELEIFTSSLEFSMQGTGALSAFNRHVLLSNTQCETHTGPRTRNDPMQSFDTDMFRLQTQLPPGDLDFDLLRVTAGTGFGLPSPGHTTLMRQPTGGWAVDSFFDITYRIDFVGAPGSPLAGRSGSTTGTIRMQAGGAGGGQPVDPCLQVPRPNPGAFIDKAVHTPKPACDCFPPAGTDTMQSELSHRVRVYGVGPNGADIICDADLSGPVMVKRGAPYIDPATGLCCIDTEMVQLDLKGADPDCGDVIVRLNPDKKTLGKICAKEIGQCFPANSFFDVFIEVTLPKFNNLRLANCAPARMECMISAIPPYDCVYELNLTAVNLFRPGQCGPTINPIGVIEAAAHVPKPKCDKCPEYGPGIDTMESQLNHDIVIFGLPEKLCKAHLAGQVVVERGAPYLNADGLCCVNTRMLKLDLTGTDPACGDIKVRLCPDRPSRGTICQKTPGQCFPAISCFEVCIEIEVMGMVLETCKPATMCCEISAIPPFGCTYLLSFPNLPLFKKGTCNDPAPQPVGEIRLAEHIPLPCPPPTVTCRTDADNTVHIAVQTDPRCPCQQLIVKRTNPDGTTVDVPVAGGEITDNPCRDLPAGIHTLTYCVQCVSGGVTFPPVCCEAKVDCPPKGCKIENVRCEKTPNGIRVTWDTPQRCPDEKIEITVNDAVVTTLPGGNEFLIPGKCREIFPNGVGRICVICRCPDGTESRACCEIRCKTRFIRCDYNCNGNVDEPISDALGALYHRFLGTFTPCCDAVTDCNSDGNYDIGDPIYLLTWAFIGAGLPSPVAPYPHCGEDPDLECPEHPTCN